MKRSCLEVFVIALVAHTSWASYHVLVTEKELDFSEPQDLYLPQSRSKRSLADPNDILDNLISDYDEGGSGSGDDIFSREQTLQFFVKNPDQKNTARASLSDLMPGNAVLTDFSIHNHEKTYRFDENKAMGNQEAMAEFQNSAQSGRSAIMIGDVQTINSRCSDCRFNTDESSSITAVITIAPGDVLSVSLSFIVPLPIDSIEYLKDLYRTDATIEVPASTTDFAGVIMSPNYPDPYPNNADITWLIRFAASDTVVSVSLISFESESCCDHLYIYDGEFDSSPVLAVISGQSYSSDPILSTGSSMLLKFQSDCLGNDGGFSLEFTTASASSDFDPDKLPSNQTFNVFSDAGSIYSPGYPTSYPPSSTLTWTVTSGIDSYLSFQIIDFDTNGGESLSIYDDLSGYNLVTLSSSSAIAYHYSIESSGNKALITFFSTQRIIPKRGFYITFQSHLLFNPCSYNISIAKNDYEEKILTSPNYPQNYGNNEFCTWFLDVPSPNIVRIEVETLDLESGYDNLEIYDGDREYPMTTLSGSGGKNLQYLTTGSTASIVFKSDHSQTDVGFQIKYRNYPVFNNCYGNSSTQEINFSEGLITNPQFPYEDYSAGECTWLITVADDTIVSIYLLQINIYYYSGQISFYDGDSKQDDVLWSGDYSDIYDSAMIRSSSNKVLIYFENVYYDYYRFAIRFSETQKDNTCGITLVDSPGVIKSPDYPRHFPNNTNCDWLIQAPNDDVITLDVEQLSYDYSDSITLYDGNTQYSSVLMRCSYYNSYRCYSGSTIFSSSNSIFIEASVTTDYVYFKFKYVFSSDSEALITQFNDYSGYANSPNFPDDYQNSYEHVYKISVPSGSIQFDFISFETESCCDYLTLYDGDSTSSSSQIASLNGYHDGYSGQTTSNSLTMYFYTDGSVTSKGFQMKYCGSSGQCLAGGISNEAAETAYSYQQNYDYYYYYYYYSVPFSSPRVLGYYPPNTDFYWYMDCGSYSDHVHYYFYHIDIDSSDFVNIYYDFGTDSWKLIRTLSNFVNFEYDYSISSYGPTSTTWFHSDSEFSGEGFSARYECH